MADDRQAEMFAALRDAPAALGNHKRRISYCLKHWAEHGIPLSVCADRRHLDRSVNTLKAYARKLKLKFPDYVPDALKTPEERKRGAKK